MSNRPIYTRTVSYSTVKYSTVQHDVPLYVRLYPGCTIPYFLTMSSLIILWRQLISVRVVYTYSMFMYCILFNPKNVVFQDNPVYELSGNPDYNYEEGVAE